MIDNTDIEKDFDILERYYQISDSNIFLSIFVEHESKDIVFQKYMNISKKYDSKLSVIRDVKDFEVCLEEPLKKSLLSNINFPSNQTIIVDLIHNNETEKIYSKLLSNIHFIREKKIHLHLAIESSHIREYIAGSDIWEFRTKIFDYENIGQKIQLKNNIETKLPFIEKTKKKMKI